MSVELNGRGPGMVPVALPGAHVSRSGWKLSHRSRNRHAPKTHVRGATETERVDPSPGALGHPAVFGRARRSPCGLPVNKLGSRQAGARRLKARSNPRAEVVVRSDGLAPYLGNAERGTREGKSSSCACSDLHHLGRMEFVEVLGILSI